VRHDEAGTNPDESAGSALGHPDVESTPSAQAALRQDNAARQVRREVGLASGCVILVLDTAVKALFIAFWFLLFSVIRLQAGF
jgi:hypothetical protein